MLDCKLLDIVAATPAPFTVSPISDKRAGDETLQQVELGKLQTQRPHPSACQTANTSGLLPDKQASKQKTLFQAWNKTEPVPGTSRSVPKFGQSKSNLTAHQAAEMAAESIDLTDDDLIEAAEMMESTMNDMPGSSYQPGKDVEHLPGFDNSLGNIWIYPTNYPVREYQFSIVKNALMKNTLVSLPTGLGKTFIAAVVMYNFYRWYPQGKIIFMAPTKPLVSQQIEACYKIMGIPLEDQVEITGVTTSVYKREALWSSKRVFFLTPQVINNDLARGVCPAAQIKCVVIDEAHKAQGKHAYCQVINQLVSCNREFRVLALSATPGTDVKSVQQVITNLLISHVEIRSEDSIDIQRFSHQRKVEKVVCKLDETMKTMRDNYLKVIEIFTKSLVNRRALFERETSSYSKYGILMARDQFRKDPPQGLNKYEMGSIEGDFATCISLLHGLELLQQHGMRSFFIFLKAMMEGEKGNIRAKTVLGANPLFREMYQNLTDMFGSSPNSIVLLTQAGQTQKSMHKAGPTTKSSSYVYSHPKIARLEEVVLNHFRSFSPSHENDATRVMIFVQYRDSVQEITELLQTHRPLIRAMQFVGHSTASGKIAKFTQKDQLKVVSKFRSGGYNTLISTCVGEEGLDIGDVDLIVCFDAHKSPIRLVQRMGRTGRKRKGRIVMLVTEGKEERDYNSSVSNKKSIQKAITGNSSRSLQFYRHNPRLIPRGLNPQPFKMQMNIKEKPQPSTGATKGNKKKPKKSENADISVLMKKAENQNSVFLNPEQVKEWDEKLKLSAREKENLKTLSIAGYMQCLQSRKVTSPPNRPKLSLSDWTLWQTRLQDSKQTGHSSTTNNFVEIMEICDLIKQTDDADFEQNIAPFLGGKYNKSKMECGKKATKLDDNITSKQKPTKILTKEKKLSKKLEKVVKADDDSLPPKLSLVEDFVSEKLKKVFPVKRNFKNKLALFAAEMDDDLSDGNEDDTLKGIESILGDDHEVIVESSNDGPAETPERSPTPKSNRSSPEYLECLPDFNMGDWDMEDSPTEKNSFSPGRPENFSDDLKTMESVRGAENSPKLDEKTTVLGEANPLLNFVDNISVISTPTPADLKTSDIPKKYRSEDNFQSGTPSSISSLSLDFMDNFGSDVSDTDESTKKAKPLKRACFSLGNSDTDVEERTAPKAEKVSVNPFKSSIDYLKKVSHAKSIKSKQETVENNSPPLLRTKSKPDGNSLGFDWRHEETEKASFVGGNQKALEDRVSSIDDIPRDHAVNATKTGAIENKEVLRTKHLSHDISADMFATPQFDLDFDLGDFEDDTEPIEEVGNDVSKGSPVLTSKNKNRKPSGNENSETSISNGSESFLARVTLSQRNENQVLFADFPKMQNVPVAEVKPQRSTLLVGPVNVAVCQDEETQNRDYFEEDLDFVQDDENLVQQEAVTKSSGPVKRKRSDGSPENIPSKRAKETENVAFLSPKSISTHSGILKTPKTGQKSCVYEDSPLIKQKRYLQSKKLLFSPESELSQQTTSTSEEEEQSLSKFMSSKVSKVTVNTNMAHKIEVESPLLRFRKANHPKKHSTPKYDVKRNKILSESSEEDANFETSIPLMATCKDQKKILKINKNVKKTGLRGRMQEFIDDEAEVSDDGIKVSSDEDEAINREALEEMKDFVNDATMLTQHVKDGSVIDEQAMYLQRKPDFFAEEGKFEGHHGKFKLAYGVGEGMDVFSQEIPTDVSGYEEDSFVCDEEEDVRDNMTAFGEITLLEDVPDTGGKKQRVTRRQAELNKLQKLNYDASPVLPIVNKLKKEKASRKRIVCFDDSTDSIESDHKSSNPTPDVSKTKETKSVSSSWSCPACTLINKPSSVICELCDCEKPNVGNEMPTTSYQTWTCKLCTYINRDNSDVCGMCGESLNKKPIAKVPENTAKSTNLMEKSKLDDRGHSKSNVVSTTTSTDFASRSAAGDLDTIPATPVVTKRKLEVKKRLDLSTPKTSTSVHRETVLHSPGSVSSSFSLSSSFSSTSNAERDERLKKCREKQMQFRARMEKRRSGKLSTSQEVKVTTPTHSKTNSTISLTKTSLQFNTPIGSLPDVINSSLVSPISKETGNSDKNVVLVDSKELSSSQPIITSLKCKHKAHVTVASISNAGYIIGRGTAVERKMVSDMSQVSNKQKLVVRFQQLNKNFDRVYLIVEQDRVKKKGPGASDGRPLRSHCYISTMCTLALTNIRILYSDNQEETANILHMLATREKGLKRGIDLAAAEKANDAKYRSLLRLYSLLPKVSFVSALYMCLNFSSLKEAASSSVEKLMEKAHLTAYAAAEVYSFFRRQFDLQMTPSR